MNTATIAMKNAAPHTVIHANELPATTPSCLMSRDRLLRPISATSGSTK